MIYNRFAVNATNSPELKPACAPFHRQREADSRRENGSD